MAGRYDQFLSEAFYRAPKLSVKLPWEIGNSWLSTALGLAKKPKLTHIDVPISAPIMPTVQGQTSSCSATSLVQHTGFAPAFSRAIRRLRDIAWPEAVDQERQHCIMLWRVVLESKYSAFQTGRFLIQEATSESDTSKISTTIVDTFEGKANRTLYKRANSLLKFIKYCKDSDPPCEPFPVTEEICYSYVKHLRESGAAASVPGDFRSALAFSMGVLGLDGVRDVLESRRITGAAFSVMVKKKKLKQKKVLTVPMIVSLERRTCFAETIQDRIGAGTFTLILYLRARFTDAQHIEEMEEDRFEGKGYLQCMTSKTKTSTTLEKKTRFLPMAATTEGLSGLDWVKQYLQDRKEAGIPCGRSLPFLPAPKKQGGWYQRGVTASEASVWLRETLIADGHDPASVADVASHSLKATPLSIASKYGLGKGVRRMLGYHVGKDDWSLLTYSRDAMSSPLRMLDEVFESIRLNRFNPDATRSGRFNMPLQPTPKTMARPRVDDPTETVLSPVSELCGVCQASMDHGNFVTHCGVCHKDGCACCLMVECNLSDEIQIDVCVDCLQIVHTGDDRDSDDSFEKLSETSEASSNSSSNSSGSEDDEPGPGEMEELRSVVEDLVSDQGVLQPLTKNRFAGQFMFRHEVHGTVHWNHKDSLVKLACGRKVQQGFKLLPEYPVFVSPRCSQCFGTDKNIINLASSESDNDIA